MTYTFMQRLLLTATMALGLAACASDGDKAYDSTGPNNLHIKASIEDGSFVTNYAAYLYIYEVNEGCKRNYLGYIKLASDSQALEYNLPVGKPLIVTAEFVVSHGSHSQSREQYEYLIQPRQKQEYFADIRFKASMYKFNLMGSNAGGTKYPVDRKNHAGCVLKG